LRHFVRFNSTGNMQKVSKRNDFPKDDKDEMGIYINSRILPPEWVFQIDDLNSDFLEEKRW